MPCWRIPFFVGRKTSRSNPMTPCTHRQHTDLCPPQPMIPTDFIPIHMHENFLSCNSPLRPGGGLLIPFPLLILTLILLTILHGISVRLFTPRKDIIRSLHAQRTKNSCGPGFSYLISSDALYSVILSILTYGKIATPGGADASKQKCTARNIRLTARSYMSSQRPTKC